MEVIKEVAEKYGKTPAQVSLNWLITSSKVVVPIPGAKNPSQATDNAAAAGWRLSYEDWARIEKTSRSIRITRVIW